MKDLICDGCSLLCDDVSAEVDEESVSSLGLCRLGHAHLETAIQQRETTVINRMETEQDTTSLDEGLSHISDLLVAAQNPLLLGLTNASNETIRKSISIAAALGASLFASSNLAAQQSLSHPLHDSGFEIDLEYVRNHGEFIVYWGSNPADSLHRHPSRFAVLPQGESIPEGVESRTIGVVDVRRTETMKMASHRLIIPPGKDSQLLNVVASELSGESAVKDGILDISAGELIGFIKGIQKSDCTIIFYGSGLVNSGYAEQNLDALNSLIESIRNNGKKAYAMPMFPETNTMGNIQVTNELTSITGPMHFTRGNGSPRYESSILKRLESGEFDAVLVIEDDILTMLPGSLARKLAESDLLYIGPSGTPTEKSAKIAIQTPDSMLTGRQTMLRIDLAEFEIPAWTNIASSSDTSEDCLKKILAMINDRIE